MDVIIEIKQALQRFWEQYWLGDGTGFCPLCKSHGFEESQRYASFILSPVLTARTFEDTTPYDISQYYAVCEMHGWQVRVKFTNTNLLSGIVNDSLLDLAKSMFTGIREQIEQQLLYKIYQDSDNAQHYAINQTTEQNNVLDSIHVAENTLSEQKFPETGRWIIMDSSMQNSLLESMASEPKHLREAILYGKNPYHNFHFYKLDTSRFIGPMKNILKGRLILFHENAVGCAYTKELTVTEATARPSNTYYDCELRFGAVTNEGAGTGQIVVSDNTD